MNYRAVVLLALHQKALNLTALLVALHHLPIQVHAVLIAVKVAASAVVLQAQAVCQVHQAKNLLAVLLLPFPRAPCQPVVHVHPLQHQLCIFALLQAVDVVKVVFQANAVALVAHLAALNQAVVLLHPLQRALHQVAVHVHHHPHPLEVLVVLLAADVVKVAFRAVTVVLVAHAAALHRSAVLLRLFRKALPPAALLVHPHLHLLEVQYVLLVVSVVRVAFQAVAAVLVAHLVALVHAAWSQVCLQVNYQVVAHAAAAVCHQVTLVVLAVVSS